ncbi:hypothetical protein GUJ93_ZPchr0003g18581 [Zizania palustris]|uniref:DUF7731 domain-containing protein n=1 Tax=Zizania palustris TaxID=103762 RepID=A0A8J5VY31_ZIZPA|nr:hypothetical protein GUJ93_ZPchr0003g18581 [Zizania palustris]
MRCLSLMDSHASRHTLILAAAVIFCTVISPCKAQDAVQVVAKAALCFDNHTVINNCLQQIGINGSNASPRSGSHSAALEKIQTSANASAALCDAPCFGHMMKMTDCVDDILSNFHGYSANLIKGIRAMFEMSCKASAAAPGNGTNGTAAAGDADDRHSPSHGEIHLQIY